MSWIFCCDTEMSLRDESLQRRKTGESWENIWCTILKERILKKFPTFKETAWCAKRSSEEKCYAYFRIQEKIEHGNQPFHYFIHAGDVEGVEFYLAANEEKILKEEWGKTIDDPVGGLNAKFSRLQPLHIAALGWEDSHIKIAERLIKAGAEVEVPCEHQSDVVWQAVLSRKNNPRALESLPRTSGMRALIQIAYAENYLKRRGVNQEENADLAFEYFKKAKQSDIFVFEKYMRKVFVGSDVAMRLYSNEDLELFYCVPGVLVLASAKNKFRVAWFYENKRLSNITQEDSRERMLSNMAQLYAESGLIGCEDALVSLDNLRSQTDSCLYKMLDGNTISDILTHHFSGEPIKYEHQFHWNSCSGGMIIAGCVLAALAAPVLLIAFLHVVPWIAVAALIGIVLFEIGFGIGLSEVHEIAREKNLKQLVKASESHELVQEKAEASQEKSKQTEKMKEEEPLLLPYKLRQDVIEHLSSYILALEDAVLENLSQAIVENYENTGFRKRHPTVVKILTFGIYANHQSRASAELTALLKSNESLSGKRQSVHDYLLDTNNCGKQLFCSIVTCARENYRNRRKQFIDYYQTKEPLQKFKFEMPESKPCESETRPLLQSPT